METTKITLKTLMLSICAIAGLEIVWPQIGADRILSPFVGLGLLRLLEIMLLTGICLTVEKNAAAIGLAPVQMLAGFQKGLAWSACFAATAGILAAVLYVAGADPIVFITAPLPVAQSEQSAVFFMVGGVIGPVAEEIFFRGILYGFFRRWGIFAAVLLSTLLFVLPHLGGGAIPLTQLVGGIVFGITYEKEKSLITPITIHCLGNLVIFSLPFFILD